MCTLESLQTLMYMTVNKGKKKRIFIFLKNFTSIAQTPHGACPLRFCGSLTCHQAADPSALSTDHSYYGKSRLKITGLYNNNYNI